MHSLHQWSGYVVAMLFPPSLPVWPFSQTLDLSCSLMHLDSVRMLADRGHSTRFEEFLLLYRFTAHLKSRACKIIPTIGHGGLQGCEMLRITHCLDSRLTDGAKFVSPTRRPLLCSSETLSSCFWYSFLLGAE
jgi:hypothetical protein